MPPIQAFHQELKKSVIYELLAAPAKLLKCITLSLWNSHFRDCRQTDICQIRKHVQIQTHLLRLLLSDGNLLADTEDKKVCKYTPGPFPIYKQYHILAGVLSHI